MEKIKGLIDSKKTSIYYSLKNCYMRENMKSVKYIIAYIFIMLIFAGNTYAAKLSFNIKPGFDNLYQPGEWMPVVVEMDNTIESKSSDSANVDIKGIISLVLTDTNGQDISYSRDFELPQFSKKRFFLYAKLSSLSKEPTLQIKDKNNKAISTVQLKLKPVEYYKSIMLVVTDQASFTIPQLISKNVTELVTIPPDELPDIKNGLDSVDMIFLNDAPDKNMNEEQKTALAQWVMDGGALFCMGGSNYSGYQNSFLKDYMPAMPDGISVLDLAGPASVSGDETKIPVNSAKLTEGKILYSIGNTPLLFCRSFGKGKVYFWASDTSSLYGEKNIHFKRVINGIFPFRKINNKENFFWQRFLQIYNLGHKDAGKPPSLMFITLFILVYVLILGPVNFLVLRKRKKLEFAWISTPLIILAFTLSVYFVSLMTKGRDYYSWEFNKISISPGSKYSINESLTGIFAPKNFSLNAVPSLDNALISQKADYDDSLLSACMGDKFYNYTQVQMGAAQKQKLISSLLPELGTNYVLKNSKFSIQNKNIPQWSMDFSKIDGAAPFTGRIDGYVNYDKEILSGEAANYSSITLKDAFIMIGNYPVYIGTLKPEEKKSFSFSEWNEIDQINSEVSAATLFNIKSKDMKNESPEECDFRKCIFSSYINSLDNLSRWNSDKNNVRLIGWIEQKEDVMKYNIEAPKKRKHTFVQMPLIWNKLNGYFSFSKEQMQIDIVSAEGVDFQFTGTNGLEFGRDTALYLMASPPLNDCMVIADSMEISCQFSNIPFENLEILAYNYQKDFWEKLEWSIDNNNILHCRLLNANNYVSSVNGRAFFRVRQVDNNKNYQYYGNKTMYFFDIKMTGKVNGGI